MGQLLVLLILYTTPDELPITHLHVRHPDLTFGFDALGFFATGGFGGIDSILTFIKKTYKQEHTRSHGQQRRMRKRMLDVCLQWRLSLIESDLYCTLEGLYNSVMDNFF